MNNAVNIAHISAPRGERPSETSKISIAAAFAAFASFGGKGSPAESECLVAAPIRRMENWFGELRCLVWPAVAALGILKEGHRIE